VSEFTPEIFENIKGDVLIVSNYMYKSSIESRRKDYDDFYRSMTYRNKDEMKAVLGSVETNVFLKQFKQDTENLNARLDKFF
jgi:ketol-acid reductoisomerase